MHPLLLQLHPTRSCPLGSFWILLDVIITMLKWDCLASLCVFFSKISVANLPDVVHFLFQIRMMAKRSTLIFPYVLDCCLVARYVLISFITSWNLLKKKKNKRHRLQKKKKVSTFYFTTCFVPSFILTSSNAITKL